jgi:hypothetical protein
VLIMIVEAQVLVSSVADMHPTFKTNFTRVTGPGLRGPWPSASPSDYRWLGFRWSSNGPTVQRKKLALVPGPDGSVHSFTYTTYTQHSIPGGGSTAATCRASGNDCLPFTHMAYHVRQFSASVHSTAQPVARFKSDDSITFAVVTILVARYADARLSLPAVPPRGWEDFDSHRDAAYNESYARAAVAVMSRQLRPLNFTYFIIGGWSARGNVAAGGAVDNNPQHHYTMLDEFGRPVPDDVRFPSAALSNVSCNCMPRNCQDKTSWRCTDPVCICPEGSRSLRPFRELVAGSGLQLGIWTWRGVHVAAVELGLRVKGTPYTAADIVVRAADDTPCTSLNKSCPANCWTNCWPVSCQLLADKWRVSSAK